MYPGFVIEVTGISACGRFLRGEVVTYPDWPKSREPLRARIAWCHWYWLPVDPKHTFVINSR
jgi:hypothetical protein